MSRKKKRILKRALWICEEQMTEPDKKRIIEIAGEELEFIEYNFSIDYENFSYDDLYETWLMVHTFDCVITTLPEDIALKFWHAVIECLVKLYVNISTKDGEKVILAIIDKS